MSAGAGWDRPRRRFAFFHNFCQKGIFLLDKRLETR